MAKGPSPWRLPAQEPPHCAQDALELGERHQPPSPGPWVLAVGCQAHSWCRPMVPATPRTAGGGLPRAPSSRLPAAQGGGWSVTHSLQVLQVALGVQEALAQQLQARVLQRVVAEVQLPQGGHGAQHVGQDPTAGFGQAAVLEAGVQPSWPSARPPSALANPVPKGAHQAQPHKRARDLGSPGSTMGLLEAL